ncbi:MAG: hypothetical protein KDJ38_18825, partial [Gammaproteobacteria bacterium]|nr:hypothetical protein [Gammaproteobacteria bacterium]
TDSKNQLIARRQLEIIQIRQERQSIVSKDLYNVKAPFPVTVFTDGVHNPRKRPTHWHPQNLL